MAEVSMRLAGESAKPMARKVSFTVDSLNRASCPPGKDRAYVYDTRTPGLCLMATETGSKAFYYLKKVAGRTQRVRLGRFPEISIEQARKLATTTSAKLAEGIDVQAEKRRVRIEPTIKGLFDYYFEHSKQHKKERSWQDDEKQYKRYLTSWQGRRLSQIQHGDVKALHAKIGTDHGHYAANRLLAMLHTMFNVAAEIGYATTNPAHGVKKYREQSRARFVGGDELPRLIASIQQEAGDFPDFFLLAMWTGARRSNLQAMAWSEVNMTAKTWTIPGIKAKAHEPIIVPLAEPAMEILTARLMARRDDNPWVFPSRGKSGHLEEPKLAWKRILERAGISDLRIHDLRRTMGSWQAATGASLSLIGKSLGHRNVATTAIYARLNIDPVRESVNKATEAMQAAVEAAKQKSE